MSLVRVDFQSAGGGGRPESEDDNKLTAPRIAQPADTQSSA